MKNRESLKRKPKEDWVIQSFLNRGFKSAYYGNLKKQICEIITASTIVWLLLFKSCWCNHVAFPSYMFSNLWYILI